MAGDWIKMRNDLRTDPTVFKLASMTGLDRFAIVGRLAEFWGWADKHAVDGYVDGATPQVVDDVVVYEGFAEKLQAVGWLELTATGIRIPNHERHNGDSAKERTLKSARQARWREKKASEATPMPVDEKPSTSASTREEKRREEINTPLPPKGEEFPGFDRFWSAWPSGDRKQARGKCLDAWKKAKAEPVAALVLAHVERMKASDLWTKERGQFVPAPLVYLNQRRWEGADASANDDPYGLKGAL